MNVLILKGDSPRHNYFAKKIIEIEGISCQIISPKRLGVNRLGKMLKKSPLTFFARVSKYVLQSVRNWEKKEENYFGKISLPKEVKVESLNSESTINLIKTHTPELIVAFGIPIISNDMINIPKYGAINLHGGISPEYKGGNTIFWPLYKGDIKKVGATIHYMVKKVDSGKVISKIYPDINPEDDEFSVSAKTFKYSTEEMMNVIEWIKRNMKSISGVDQKEKGHLYLAKHRTFFIDIIGMSVIKQNIKNISSSKLVERFY